MAKRGRPQMAYSRVYVRGTARIVVNYANGYVLQVTADGFRMTKFSELKRLTPAMVERAAEAWGYVLEAQKRKVAA